MRIPDSVTRPTRAVTLLVALVAALCGCSQGQDDETSVQGAAAETVGTQEPPSQLPVVVQQLDIDASEYVFNISPDTSAGLKPGWTLLEFNNVGEEPHQVMFARIKDDVDMEELAAAGAGDSSGAGAIEFVDMIGGVSYIGAGQKTTALVNLPEGTVMAMCYVPDGDGVAHALMGMSQTLTVSESADVPAFSGTVPGDGEVVGTIALAQDGYEFPAEFGAGWYHLENTDSALHELALLRLGDPIDEEQTGVLVEDLAANRTPEVELEAVGGMGAISAGFDGYLYLDLAEGDYLAVDFMPDPGDPRPHMLDGYYGGFTV